MPLSGSQSTRPAWPCTDTERCVSHTSCLVGGRAARNRPSGIRECTLVVVAVAVMTVVVAVAAMVVAMCCRRRELSVLVTHSAGPVETARAWRPGRRSRRRGAMGALQPVTRRNTSLARSLGMV